MQSSTSTSTHLSPFNSLHRRPSYCTDIHDSSPTGRPSFIPKRRPSGGSSAKQTLREDGSASPNPLQGQIRIVEETTSEDSATPQTIPRSFCTFPRIKPELSRGEAPQAENELPPPPNTPTEVDFARAPPDQQDALTLTNLAGTLTASDLVSVETPGSFESIVLPRKKSGELVKPSLKSTGFAGWATSTSARARTKSAPTTPLGSKSVHFDAHLEHVKLFLAEQKPLAVNRDGSQTETSEGDTTDNNSHFFRITGATLRIKPIVLPELPSEPWTFDVRIENVSLDGTALVGTVIVRNVAFTKWVAVRFTLDAWLTTSEVAAHHISSLRDDTFDRFEFRIRLVDYMNGIEFKRLIFCARFSVEGRQMWDSNGGRNYEVGFEKVKEDPAKYKHASSLSGDKNGVARVVDLRKQLQKVVQNVPRGGSPTPTITPNRKKSRGLRVWLGEHPLKGDDDDDDDDYPTPSFLSRSRSPPPSDGQKVSNTPRLSNKDVPLSARYDFGASLRSPNWIPPQVHSRSPIPFPTPSRPKTTQRRTRSPPPSPFTSTTTPFPPAGQHRRSMTVSPTASPRETGPQGSPRDTVDFTDGEVSRRRCSQDDTSCVEDRPRRHARGWIQGSSFKQIVADEVPLKRTPPGMPTVTPPTPPRLRSETQSNGEGSSSSSSDSPSISPSTSQEPLDVVWGALHRSEEENFPSSPSLSTSSSTPTSVSPLSALVELPRAASEDNFVTLSVPERSRGQRPSINSTPYFSFLDQYVLSFFSFRS